MAKALIFGAGKIARGFLGQILYNAGVDTAFVDAAAPLVELINSRGRYTVNVLGAPERSGVVENCRALLISDSEGIAREAADADVFFTAMGGKNLVSAAPAIASALRAAEASGKKLNVVTCENWKKPAAILEDAVRAIYPATTAGFAESVVMRSGIDATEEQRSRDPLWVNAQDFWRLPIDAEKLVSPLPAVPELDPIPDFGGFLERKFYTYNAANGTVSFVGSLLGLTYVSEAARDPRVSEILEKVYLETGEALAKKYGITLESQLEFAATSRKKLRDEIIVDTLERNARDPMRKLGPDDRLVGSARLAESFGVRPDGLATAIAAAIHYGIPKNAPRDESAELLADMLASHGTGYVLENVCRLSPDGVIYKLTLEKERELEAKGWIK